MTLAVENGHLEIVRMLVSAGARTDTDVGIGRTALTMALDNGSAEIVSSLHGQEAEGSARLQTQLAGPFCLLKEIPARVRRYHRNTAFHPAGQKILTIAEDGANSVWDLGAGDKCLDIPSPKDKPSKALFDPSGDKIATLSEQGILRIWDASDGALQTELHNPQEGIKSAAFVPGSGHVLTAGSSGGASVWDLAGSRIANTLGVGDEDVTAMAVDPLGARALTVGRSGVAGLWNLASGSLIRMMPKVTGTDHTRIAFSPDGSCVAVADTSTYFHPAGLDLAEGDRKIRVFDVGQDREETHLYPQRGWRVLHFLFSSDGQHILGCADDGGAKRPVRLHGARQEKARPKAHKRFGVWLWDALGNCISVFQGHDGSVLSARFNPGGNAVLTASFDCTARLWDTASGRQISVALKHDRCVVVAAFNASGDRIVTECEDGFCRIWIYEEQSLPRRPQGISKANGEQASHGE